MLKIENLKENEFNSYDETYNNCKFINQKFIDNDLRIDFTGCYFEKIDFSNVNLNSFIFYDCIFVNCDFSNSNLDDGGIQKVKIDDSKFIGMYISSSNLNEVTFKNCNMNYFNLSDSKLEKINFISNDMSFNTFTCLKLKNIIFEECKLVKLNIVDTNLKNINLSSCNIEGIKANLDDLKGSTLNSIQAIGLVQMLGIDVIN